MRIVLEKEMFMQNMKEAAGYVSHNENRPILCGFHIKAEMASRSITIEATDSFKMYRSIIPAFDEITEDLDIVIYPPKLNDFKKSGAFKIVFDTEEMTVSAGEMKEYIRKIDNGVFPNMDNFTTKEGFTDTITLSVDLLKEALKGMAKGKKITFSIKNNNCMAFLVDDEAPEKTMLLCGCRR